jgi:hypothetical protein
MCIWSYYPKLWAISSHVLNGFEAMILTPEQAYAILLNLQERERRLTLLASGTAPAGIQNRAAY